MTENLFTQLAKAQAEFTAPRRTKTVQVKSDRGSYTFAYAPLDEVLDAVRPALGKYGLFLTQGLVAVEGTELIRTAVYCGEQYIENFWPLINTERGAQKHGGAGTFARRYGVSALLGLAPEEDDDANGSEGNQAIVSDRRPAPAPAPKAAPAPRGNAKVKPLPPTVTKAFNEVYDPQTGEIEGVTPHLLPFQGDWIAWGGRLVSEISGTRSRATAEAWLKANQELIDKCGDEFPKVWDRMQAQIGQMRDRLPKGEPAKADFIAAK